MALGAQRPEVLRSVVWESMRAVIAGIVLGIPLAFFTGHLMESMLFGLKSYDVLSFSVALIGVTCIGVAASWVPARRASSIEPMQALRTE